MIEASQHTTVRGGHDIADNPTRPLCCSILSDAPTFSVWCNACDESVLGDHVGGHVAQESHIKNESVRLLNTSSAPSHALGYRSHSSTLFRCTWVDMPPIPGLLIAVRFPCPLSICSAGQGAGEAVPSTNPEARADLSLPADPFGDDELLEIVTIETSFANSTSSAKGKAKVEPVSLASSETCLCRNRSACRCCADVVPMLCRWW